MTPRHAGTPVSLGRVLREHRTALVPLAVALAINAVVLGAVVLPLSQRAATNEARATAAERAQAAAVADFNRAEAAREGTARASTDLNTFYDQILPGDIAAARRMIHLRFQQKAREHSVRYQRSAASEEEIKDSALNRLIVSITLTGEYDDIRMLLYELETSPDFVVIDNVSLTEGDEGEPLTVALVVSAYFKSARPFAAGSGADGR